MYLEKMHQFISEAMTKVNAFDYPNCKIQAPDYFIQGMIIEVKGLMGSINTDTKECAVTYRTFMGYEIIPNLKNSLIFGDGDVFKQNYY